MCGGEQQCQPFTGGRAWESSSGQASPPQVGGRRSRAGPTHMGEREALGRPHTGREEVPQASPIWLMGNMVSNPLENMVTLHQVS